MVIGISKAARKLFLALFMMFSLIAVISCMFLDGIDYAGKIERPSNFILIGLGCVIYLGLYYLSYFISCFGRTKINFPNSAVIHKVAKAIFPILFGIIQFVFIKEYYFHAGWDVWYIDETSRALLNGDRCTNEIIDYLSTYPNNLLLSMIWFVVQKLFIDVGFWEGYSYFALIGLNIAVFQLSAILLYLCVDDVIKERNYSIFAFLIYELLVGTSPWISIPYSDTVGILFPILVLKLGIAETNKGTNNCVLRYFLIGFVSFLAYSIKPQASIAGIATIVIACISTKSFAHLLLHKLVPCLAGIIICIGVISIAKRTVELPLDTDKSFGPAHFMMMGLNEETGGMWSGSDVSMSASYSSKDEREEANIEEIINRINTLGFQGTIKHSFKKVLSAYNDGSFAWWAEGKFAGEYSPETGSKLGYFLRNLYYQMGSLNRYWYIFSQMMWLPILVLIPFSTFFKQNEKILIIYLTLVGVFLFNLLFETRARYLLVNVPIFIIGAVVGFREIADSFEIRLHLSNQR